MKGTSAPAFYLYIHITRSLQICRTPLQSQPHMNLTWSDKDSASRPNTSKPFKFISLYSQILLHIPCRAFSFRGYQACPSSPRDSYQPGVLSASRGSPSRGHTENKSLSLTCIYNYILEYLVQCMTDVDVTVCIRRAVMKDVMATVSLFSWSSHICYSLPKTSVYRLFLGKIAFIGKSVWGRFSVSL